MVNLYIWELYHPKTNEVVTLKNVIDQLNNILINGKTIIDFYSIPGAIKDKLYILVK